MLRRSMNLVVNAIVFCSETKEDIFGGDRVRKDKEYTPDSQSNYGPPFSMFFFLTFHKSILFIPISVRMMHTSCAFFYDQNKNWVWYRPSVLLSSLVAALDKIHRAESDDLRQQSRQEDNNL